MGFLDDYKQMRDERQRKEAEMLLKESKGCLYNLFVVPIKLFSWLLYWLLGFIWKPALMLIVLLISVIILLPIKLFLYIISFGHWNLFKNRFINKISDIYSYDTTKLLPFDMD